MSFSSHFDVLAELVVGTQQTSLGRFASNPLFDRNLIPIICDFSKTMFLSVVNQYNELHLFNVDTCGKQFLHTSSQMLNIQESKWSPDCCLLATLFSQPYFTIWSLRTKCTIHTIAQHADTLAWSPDGRTLAVATNKQRTVIFFDVKTGQQIRQIQLLISCCCTKSMAWSPNGSIMATTCQAWSENYSHVTPFCIGCSPNLWDVNTGESVASLPFFKDLVEHVQFSADGSKLFFSCQRSVVVWDVKNNRMIFTSPETEFGLDSHHIAWSPDMSMILHSCVNKHNLIVDVKTGDVIRNLQCSQMVEYEPVCEVSWARNGSMLAIAYESGDIIVWETKTFRHVRSFRLPIGSIWNMSFHFFL